MWNRDFRHSPMEEATQEAQWKRAQKENIWARTSGLQRSAVYRNPIMPSYCSLLRKKENYFPCHPSQPIVVSPKALASSFHGLLGLNSDISISEFRGPHYPQRDLGSHQQNHQLLAVRTTAWGDRGDAGQGPKLGPLKDSWWKTASHYTPAQRSWYTRPPLISRNFFSGKVSHSLFKLKN